MSRSVKTRHWLLLASVLLLMLFLLLVVAELYYEGGDWSVEPQAAPARVPLSTIAELDEALRAGYPKECEDMALVGVDGIIQIAGGCVVGGEVTVRYYRLVDAWSRQGGNIAVAEFRLDVSTSCLTEIRRFRGSGRTLVFSDLPIEGELLAFSFTEYTNQLAARWTGMSSGEERRLLLDINAGVVEAHVLSGQDGKTVYSERIPWQE